MFTATWLTGGSRARRKAVRLSRSSARWLTEIPGIQSSGGTRRATLGAAQETRTAREWLVHTRSKPETQQRRPDQPLSLDTLSRRSQALAMDQDVVFWQKLSRRDVDVFAASIKSIKMLEWLKKVRSERLPFALPADENV